jgi:hypothetical protein
VNISRRGELEDGTEQKVSEDRTTYHMEGTPSTTIAVSSFSEVVPNDSFHDPEEIVLLKEILSQVLQVKMLLQFGKQKLNIEYREVEP